MTEAEAYRVLGLAPGASLEEVRAAYRRLIRRVHPDLGGSSRARRDAQRRQGAARPGLSPDPRAADRRRPRRAAPASPSSTTSTGAPSTIRTSLHRGEDLARAGCRAACRPGSSPARSRSARAPPGRRSRPCRPSSRSLGVRPPPAAAPPPGRSRSSPPAPPDRRPRPASPPPRPAPRRSPPWPRPAPPGRSTPRARPGCRPTSTSRIPCSRSFARTCCSTPRSSRAARRTRSNPSASADPGCASAW